MDTKQRWQDRLTFILGLWLFFTVAFFTQPFMLDAKTANALLMGLLIMIFSVAAITRYRPWEEWVEAVIGVWLVISPFVFGFTDMTAATVNHIVVGALIVIDSLWVAMKYPTGGRLAH